MGAAGPPQRMLVRPVAIRRKAGFDVFNVRLLIGLDKLLRAKRRYLGDLSASINDALLAVNLRTVKLVTLQGKKKQTARETQVVLLDQLIRRIKRIADARGSSMNQLVNSGLLAYYSKRAKMDRASRAARGRFMAPFDKMSVAERQQMMEGSWEPYGFAYAHSRREREEKTLRLWHKPDRSCQLQRNVDRFPTREAMPLRL